MVTDPIGCLTPPACLVQLPWCLTHSTGKNSLVAFHLPAWDRVPSPGAQPYLTPGTELFVRFPAETQVGGGEAGVLSGGRATGVHSWCDGVFLVLS